MSAESPLTSARSPLGFLTVLRRSWPNSYVISSTPCAGGRRRASRSRRDPCRRPAGPSQCRPSDPPTMKRPLIEQVARFLSRFSDLSHGAVVGKHSFERRSVASIDKRTLVCQGGRPPPPPLQSCRPQCIPPDLPPPLRLPGVPLLALRHLLVVEVGHPLREPTPP